MTALDRDAVHRRQASFANGLLVSLFGLGLAIVVLSFAVWTNATTNSTVLCFVQCGGGEKTGTDVTEATGFGDGYVTAALGLLITSLVLVALLRLRRWDTRSLLLATVAAAGIGVVSIAAVAIQGATGTWGAIVTRESLFVDEPAPGLYALAALGGAVAVVAGLLLGYRIGQEP